MISYVWLQKVKLINYQKQHILQMINNQEFSPRLQGMKPLQKGKERIQIFQQKKTKYERSISKVEKTHQIIKMEILREKEIWHDE